VNYDIFDAVNEAPVVSGDFNALNKVSEEEEKETEVFYQSDGQFFCFIVREFLEQSFKRR
jgi:hypothetical protein